MNEDIIELWGREFNLAKKGLDEAQVVSFVNELIAQRDTATQSVEHLSSLTKLAERTVAEADKLAEEVKKEAADQANAEATTIIAKAEEQGRQLIEEKRTGIINRATLEAEAIKANAEREAGLLIEREWKRIQPELRDMVGQLYAELLSQLDGLKQQVVALEAESENKLSQKAGQTSAGIMDKDVPSTEVPASVPEPVDDVLPESQQLIQIIDQTNTSELKEKVPVSADNADTSNYEGQVELEILPPIDLKQIMGIMRYLDSVPEVENTELIPIVDKPLMVVSLREPVHLIDILRTLSEVDQAREGTKVETTGNGSAESKRRKIQITLAGDSVLDEARKKLDSEVSSTLSSSQ